jgi:tryptophan synthase alpha chain
MSIPAAFGDNGKRAALMPYLMGGYPSIEESVSAGLAAVDAGADLLELGVPFSDPLADGPVIQRASERALKSGTTLRKTLDMIRDHRAQIAAPIVLFTYVNPIVRMGESAFARAAADAGVDGVLVLDLPVEEARSFRQRLVDADMDSIFLLSPTTTDERIRQSAELGRGFLYVISRLGVTGARERLGADAEPLVRRIRAHSDLPVAIGFGISRPEHVAEVGRWADAAVVGSALVNVIAEHGASSDLVDRVGAYARWLKGLS